MPDRKRRVRRVLLVEDRLAHMFAMKSLFEREGWAVSVGRTLDQAMEGLNQSPDWIVLNVGLADDGGERFLRRMRAERISTPVVVLSSPEQLNDRGFVRSMMRAGSVVPMATPIAFRLLYNLCSGEQRTEAGVA